MAHVVGVPKRDPCQKCELPVFLAERLTVGKKVYHRTCLKCARCGYQLTPGSFYETEIDEQYCCETCPDEEVTQKGIEQLPCDGAVSASDSSNVELRNTPECEGNALQTPVKSVRSSIKERLAFFENHRDNCESDTKLLQKSLSDEEKSKSLQRIERFPEIIETQYTSNVALSNFLINKFDDEEDHSDPSFSIQNSNMEMSDSEDNSDDLKNLSLPPELPKSLPPPLLDLNMEKSSELIKSFSVSTPIVSACEQSAENLDIKEGSPHEIQNSELQNYRSPSTIENTNNNNNGKNNEKHISTLAVNIEYIAVEQQTENETVCLEFSATNQDCVTKDKSADELIMETAAEDIQHVKDNRDLIESNDNTEEIQTLISSEDCVVEVPTNPTVSPVIHDDLKQFEVNTNNEKEKAILSKQSLEKANENEDLTIDEDISSKSLKNSVVTEVDKKTATLESESLKTALLDDKVPFKIETKDNLELKTNLDDKKEHFEKKNSEENINDIQTLRKNSIKTAIEEYPDDLNPFKSDEEDEQVLENNKENIQLKTSYISAKKDSLNPFDSSDDEVELEKGQKSKTSVNSTPKVPPPRPPPPRISKNPFGSEDEDETIAQTFTRRSSVTGSQNRKTPIPTPRSNISQSQNPTPEPTPRLSTKVNTSIGYSASTTHSNSSLPNLQNANEFYGSANSLYSSNTTPYNLLRNSDIRSSNNSLNLSAGGTIRSRKSRRAPLPPAPVKELFPSNETINNSSKASTPSSSTVGTPKSGRKKRPAPAPPKPARLEPSQPPQIHVDTVSAQSKNLNNYPLQSELDSKLSDEEKALLEGKLLQSLHNTDSDLLLSPASRRSSKRLIPLDQELLEEHGSLQYAEETSSQCDDFKQQNQQKHPELYEEEPSVVYRRVLIPQNLETPTHEHNAFVDGLNKSPVGERQLEKLKDNKEANNRNRQSQISITSSGADDNDPLFNKSSHGKWKRRKGPAPALPIPPRKVLQMLPLQEIKHELEIIEVQQQGLEKQGVILEKMIRDRCEGQNGEPLNASGLTDESGDSASGSSTAENSKEVENLILQLFELVNEKNELFRRQAELMYLRRQHRLEQEQADLEYEIRTLMAQPERNKTDSDKTREEALIERLVEVVQLRNEVVECLEMDRLREAEEDQSIKQRLESHIANRENNSNTKKPLTKLSKKEKKKQKEAKKLFRSKKLDVDKDADESEVNGDKLKSKKKKKLLIF